MGVNNQRRFFLKSIVAGSSALFGGCLGPFSETTSNEAPIYINNYDSVSHQVNISVSLTNDPFEAEVSVEPQSLVKVTNVKNDGICIRVDVVDLDEGVRETCPSEGESDYSPHGYYVDILSQQITHEVFQWVVRPIPEGNASTSPDLSYESPGIRRL